MKRKKTDQYIKYEIDNLPIRNEVKDKIKKEILAEMEAILLIQTIGRMQGRQDECIEELINGVLKKIEELQEDIKVFSERLAVLEEKVA